MSLKTKAKTSSDIKLNKVFSPNGKVLKKSKEHASRIDDLKGKDLTFAVTLCDLGHDECVVSVREGKVRVGRMYLNQNGRFLRFRKTSGLKPTSRWGAGLMPVG